MEQRDGKPAAVVIDALESRTLLNSHALTVADVEGIIARAASQAQNRQAIVVTDREGVILGMFSLGNATSLTLTKALTRARTAAFFQSREDAFTTRTARFIIQDHFPHPVPNTPGGPLYGVQFSSLPGSDVVSGPAISGDPGGIPLFKNGEPAGGIGVAGDGNDIAVRADLRGVPNIDVDNPSNGFFNGVEESDFDEAVALAGAQGFMAPNLIRADRIFLDGLRLPFTKDQPASAKANRSLSDIITSGDGMLRSFSALGKASTEIIASQTPPWPAATFGGIEGELKNTNPEAPNFGIVSSNDTKFGVPRPGSDRLTAKDVELIIADAVNRAKITRAAIREPIGVPARVHIAVVDRDGDILGVFRMGDGTNFSFDVAVQKARTAAFFSDNDHAFTTRAIGFMSQRFFPVGIDRARTGHFFMLQNELSTLAGNLGAQLTNGKKNPLANGITIFPGGVPLYKNGLLVGAIGVSGDGVDQDDIISDTGSKRFRPALPIRSDFLNGNQIAPFLRQRVTVLEDCFKLTANRVSTMRMRLIEGLDGVQLPYVKFPRNPDV